MKHRNFGGLVPWVDIFMNIAAASMALFAISFLLISIDSKKEEGILPKADFLITLDWNPTENVDIDLWVKDPNGKIVSFVNKSTSGMFLDRDDLGTQHDIIANGDGTITKIEINQEVVTIRGYVPGVYTVAAHYYRGGNPQKLAISVLKLQPFRYVFKKTGIPIDNEGQEVTLVSFEVSKTGSVVSVNTDQNLFVNSRAK